MARGQAKVDPASFFRLASWQCVRSGNPTAVARSMELLHYQPASLPQDLPEVDPAELPCLVVSVGGWTYVFGHSLGLKSARALSLEFGECLAFHIDEDGGTYRCERAQHGEVVRRIYASSRDRESSSHGEPGNGEPPIPWADAAAAGFHGLSVDEVLQFGAAWGADARTVLSGQGQRAFMASPRPMVTRDTGRRTSLVATLAGAVFVLGVLAAGGYSVYWLAQSDQTQAAAQFCENQWGCGGCVGCTASPPHACAERFDACEEDEGCVALTQCLESCQDLQARAGFRAPDPSAEPCFAQCRADHAGGLEAYCAWTECSYRQACADLCTDPGYLALAACR